MQTCNGRGTKKLTDVAPRETGLPGNRHIKQWRCNGRRKQLVRPKTADRPRDKTLGNAGKQSHEEKPPNQRRKRKVPGASWRSNDGELCCATCKPEERTLQDGARREGRAKAKRWRGGRLFVFRRRCQWRNQSVFFTTKVGRVSADGCLSLCRCLRAGGNRLLPWRALGCATPAATALCDTAGMERVGAEITQVCFARRRAGTQLAEGRGCGAGKTKGGSFACLLPTAPDVLACQELVVEVVCGFFWQRGERRAQSSLGLSHVCSREAGAERHMRARKSERNGGHEAATVRLVWWDRQK
ncbi:hypothetical protein ERJ75_000598100 [Trypanosoma vivax]|nr:hypothetical protein ERJ75_000598100 [Trypanosoma vivax]